MLLALAPLAARAQSAGPADLVIVRQGQDVVAYAHNRLGGPVEVELVATELSGMDSDVAAAAAPRAARQPARCRWSG